MQNGKKSETEQRGYQPSSGCDKFGYQPSKQPGNNENVGNSAQVSNSTPPKGSSAEDA